MDDIDRKIAKIIQSDGQSSSAKIAAAVGVSVSTANERVRRLTSSGIVKAWRAVLEPQKVDANLCALILVDVGYEGEDETMKKLAGYPQIQEIHHISGAHSYLLKIRIADTTALQDFLHNSVKPLAAITATESMIVLETLKETTELVIGETSK
jgi:Lrp/AsnC family transcriptional regulator, leucine-responsive regulatory protein